MDLILRKEGRAGRITLNRPKALNALTEAMISQMAAAFADWRDDPEVALIVLDAEGDKAFCAGGDVRALYEAGRGGRSEVGPVFWADEYRLNAAIADFPKPVVSFMQGFVMGGGVGIGCHASCRVVDPQTRIAMPEVKIGLIPDVGGTHLLAQMPGQLGRYFGLTGARMSGAQAVAGGFADLLINRQTWPALKEALMQTGDLSALKRAALRTEAPFDALQSEVDRVFAQRRLSDIIDAAAGTMFEEALRGPSVLAQSASLLLIAQARAAPGLKPALEREFCYTSKSLAIGDFLEGVRAAIIDKDGAPEWLFENAAEVDEHLLAQLMAPRSDGMTVFEGSGQNSVLMGEIE